MAADDAPVTLDRQRLQRRIFALSILASGVSGLALVFALPESLRLALYIKWGPSWALISLLLLCAAALHYGVLQLRSASTGARRILLIDAAITATLTCALCVLVPARALIENDETNIQATAQGIHLNFESTGIVSGLIDERGALVPELLVLDKRGVMFPLMLHAVAPHWTTFDHARYWVNGWWGWLCLFLTVRLARRLGMGHASWAGALLLASFPVFTVTLRSGLFDLANLGLLLLIALMCLRSLKPSSSSLAQAQSLLMIAAAAVVAQIRYEAVLPASMMLGLIMFRGVIKPSANRPLNLALAPVLIAPGLFRMAMPIDYEMPGPWFKPWTVMNIPDNLEQLTAWAISPEGFGTGNPLVGLIVLIGFMLWVLRRRWTMPDAWTLLALGLPFLGLTAVLMCSYWGKANMPTTVRYFMYVAVALSITAIYICKKEFPNKSGHNSFLLALSVLLLSTRLPASIRAELFTALHFHHFRDAALQVVQLAYARCNVLIVSNSGTFFLNSGISSIPLGRFAQAPAEYIERAQRSGARAVAAVLELNLGGSVAKPILDRLDHPVLVTESSSGKVAAQLYQIWPAGPANLQACPPRHVPANTLIIDPANPPRKFWETFRPRWRPDDPAHKLLTLPGEAPVER